MKISTQTGGLYKRVGDEKAIRMLAEAGYDALDYSMFDFDEETSPVFGTNFEKRALELKQLAEDCGVYFNQAHAPFPSYRVGDEEYNRAINPMIKRSIAFAAILGAKIIIVHPIALGKGQKEFNLEFYNSLIPVCREYNIKVALENMFGGNRNNGNIIPNVCSTGYEFCEFLDALPKEHFTACLDIGHAGLVGETAENMILTLGHDRLKALHVHDNNHLRDLHTLPFTQSLDWQAITGALKEIRYTGDFTLEADGFLDKFPDELLAAACKLMAQTARYLADRSEA